MNTAAVFATVPAVALFAVAFKYGPAVFARLSKWLQSSAEVGRINADAARLEAEASAKWIESATTLNGLSESVAVQLKAELDRLTKVIGEHGIQIEAGRVRYEECEERHREDSATISALDSRVVELTSEVETLRPLADRLRVSDRGGRNGPDGQPYRRRHGD